MLATVETIEILESDLIGEPVPHTLAIGKGVVVFNLKITPKSLGLKTGKAFSFGHDAYEVMNVSQVQAQNDYLKINCLRKSSKEVV